MSLANKRKSASSYVDWTNNYTTSSAVYPEKDVKDFIRYLMSHNVNGIIMINKKELEDEIGKELIDSPLKTEKELGFTPIEELFSAELPDTVKAPEGDLKGVCISGKPIELQWIHMSKVNEIRKELKKKMKCNNVSCYDLRKYIIDEVFDEKIKESGGKDDS